MADQTKALYQMEVKLPSGENGEIRTQIINLVGKEYLKFFNRLEFPNVGDSTTIYIATDENKIYRWDNINFIYRVIGSDYNDIDLINCGGAS